jgi:hypothetical protein
MSLSEQEMTTLLGLVSKASHEQLVKVSHQLKATFDLRARQATVGIRVGARVQWNGKMGHQVGEVLHVKQKYVEVKVTEGPQIGMRWNVAASMLTPAPAKSAVKP